MADIEAAVDKPIEEIAVEADEATEEVSLKKVEETTGEEAPPAEVQQEEVSEEEAVAGEDTKEAAGEKDEAVKEAADGESTEAKAETQDGESAEKKDATENGSAHGDTVAKHYNENPHVSREGRKESRIFHLRNFNNWVKSVMINEYLEKVKRNKKHRELLNVLDLGCGKGGDYLKWQKGAVNHVICADIAETSLEQCKDRYQNLKRNDDNRRHRDSAITTEFIHADCSKTRLKDSYADADIGLDMTSCQFAYHYSFESMEQADMMLKNACENLRDGAYFIGTTPDANHLVRKVKESGTNSFGNDIFSITFEDKENFPLFGGKYNFKLDDVVDCPEFLVYFPAFEKLAEKYNMKLVYKKSFHEFFQEKHEDYSGLLYRMQAMECLPVRSGKQLSNDKEDAYETAKKMLENPPSAGDPKYKSLGTLSKDEWEAAGVYCVFAFQKCNPKPVVEEPVAKPAEATTEATPADDAKMTDETTDEKVAEDGQQSEQPATDAAEENTKETEADETTQAETADDAGDGDEPAAKRNRPSEGDD